MTVIIIPPIKAVIFFDKMFIVVPEGADQLIYILESYIHDHEEYCNYLPCEDAKSNATPVNFEVSVLVCS